MVGAHMSDSGVQTISGNGEYLLGATVFITGLEWWLDTDTVEVDYLSVNPPRKLLHAGWIATGSGDGASPFDELTLQQNSITWWSFFEFESQFKVNPSGFAYDDRIVWRMGPGVIAKFQAFW
jgi:hypothetical protein